MFSARSALRWAPRPATATSAASRVGSLAPAPWQALTPARAAAIEGRRFMTAYGYMQAKALVYSRYGEPQDVLSLHRHSVPAPAGTAVNVRLLATPLNPADVNQIQGVYPSRPEMTRLLGTPEPSAVGGNEGAFEVVSTGGGVKSLRKGDWVIMKQSAQGTWRTHAQFDEAQLVRIARDGDGDGGGAADALTPLQVGTVSVNPCTAYRMIKDFCEWDWLRQGAEWLVQNGANSGVGRAAIQLAREWGIKTLNVVRERATPELTEALRQELAALGATSVITEREAATAGFLREHVQQITRGGREPVRLALNCVGGKSAAALAKLLAPGSHFVTYGAMAKQPLPLPAGLLIFKDIHFDGFWVSRWSDRNPELKLDTVNDVLRLMREGRFKDVPAEEVEWRWDTDAATLSQAVQSTLEGKRGKKTVFTFRGDE
ncbi:mitochondrial 2-enoyl thioester reductase [Ascosphaera acerosa]|nr:mitochondrial 2-enoyl thioester reductase [Ascosphaera acerosa]